MVERVAVNHLVGGSIPSPGANQRNNRKQKLKKERWGHMHHFIEVKELNQLNQLFRIIERKKNFLICKNGKDFQIGDIITFKVDKIVKDKFLDIDECFTLDYYITYIYYGNVGLKDNYICMSLCRYPGNLAD